MGTAGRPARPTVHTHTAAASSAASTPRGGGAGSPLRRPRPPPEGSALRSAPHSPHAPGLKTFGQAYMPFAAGALRGGCWQAGSPGWMGPSA